MSTLAETVGDTVAIHAVGDWVLVVRADGAVEARTHWDNGDLRAFTTAPTAEAPTPGATHRYGLSIEQVLARYAHETRFNRDPNTEHGAALRDGIIEALCAVAPEECLDDSADDRPVGVVHVNAPTDPSTYLVSEDGSDIGTYATFHPFKSGE